MFVWYCFSMDYLPRPRELEAVKAGLRRAPVMALLGPRQCGKTTLARELGAEHYFDLEDPRSLARLDEPQTALEDLTGTIVIDEVQRKPDLFPLLRVLADRRHQGTIPAAWQRLAESGEGGFRESRRSDRVSRSWPVDGRRDRRFHVAPSVAPRRVPPELSGRR